MLNSKNIRDIYFMFRCTRDRHTNCISMRNTAMRSSKNILKAYTTHTVFEGTPYCVAGRAIVHEDKVKEFSRNLKKIKSNSPRSAGIKISKILVSQ